MSQTKSPIETIDYIYEPRVKTVNIKRSVLNDRWFVTIKIENENGRSSSCEASGTCVDVDSGRKQAEDYILRTLYPGARVE